MIDSCNPNIEPHHYLRATRKLIAPLAEYLENLCQITNDERLLSSISIALGKIGAQSSLPILLDLLKKYPENPEIISSFGWYKNPAVLNELITLLKNPEYPFRDEIVRVLGEIGDIAAYNVVKELLKDENRMVRYYSCWTLYKIGATDLVTLLIPLLSDPDEWIVINTLEILSRLNDIETIPAVVGQFELSSDPRIKAMMISFLSNFKEPKLLKFFDEALHSYDPRIQANAIEAISMLKIPELEIKRRLKKFYQHSNNRVKANTLIALHKIDKDNVLRELENMIFSNSIAQRRSAAYVLSKINLDNKEKYIYTLLNDTSAQVKRWAIRALLTINENINTEIFINLLNDQNYCLRKEAIEVAKKSHSFPAKIILNLLQEEKELQVIDSILEFIVERKLQGARDLIIQKIKNNIYDIFPKYLWCLGRIGTKEDLIKLKKFVLPTNLSLLNQYYLSLLDTGDLKLIYELITVIKEAKKEVLISYITVCGEIGLYLRSFNNYSQALLMALYPLAEKEISKNLHQNTENDQYQIKFNRDDIGFAINLINNGDFDKAANFLSEYLNFYPSHTEALYYLAFCYFKIGEIEKALNLVTQLLEKVPSHSLANLLLSQIHFKLKNWQQITENYNRIKSYLKSYDTKIAVQIKGAVGLAYFHLRHYHKAIEVLQDIANSNNPDFSSCYHLALCLYAVKEFNKALEILKKLRSKIPQGNNIIKNIDELIQKIEEECLD